MSPSAQIWPNEPMDGWPANWHVEVVAETGSTNADLLSTKDLRPNRSVLMTFHQTAGQGRLGRIWEAPPGSNLLFSVLFTEIPDLAVELTHRVGVAAVIASQRVAGVQAKLKWPNDLLVDDAKLAGILSQRSGSAVVVGTGINVGWAPAGAARLGDNLSPVEVLAEILRAYDELPADPAQMRELYRSHLGTLGRQVRIELPDSEIVGTALDVTPEGQLVVLDTCGITHRCDVGDVVHLRPA
jgi:BirA family transcriptional regulator, biotin operon repressor / biotin---[acetyl-CoA-carboxylase] ligase